MDLLICVFGSTIGTYCWFTFTAKANATYSGTAVSQTDEIVIGLSSDVELPGFADAHNLFEDKTSVTGKYIYWAQENRALTADAISDYETRFGYASNQMPATSSGEYNLGEELSLKTAPIYMTDTEFTKAKKNEYSHMQFAFKTKNKDINIFLKKGDVKCEKDVKKALRIYFQNPLDPTNAVILNPTATAKGTTDVGGILNLNTIMDNYFDYVSGTSFEHIYGQYYDLEYSGATYPKETPIPKEEITCFNSNHLEGLLVPTFTPAKAQYLSNADIVGKHCLTSSDPMNKIALLDTTIYIEGWDHSCIDSAISYMYDLSLEFALRNA